MKEIRNYSNLSSAEAINIPNDAFILIRNGSDFKVYVYLCSKCDEYGCSTVSINDIANDTLLSKGTILRSIKWLEDNHFIEKNKSFNSTNKYDIYYMDFDVDTSKEGDIIEVTIIEKEYEKNKHKRKVDYEYTKWRNDVLERDNYTCKLCGKTDEEVILNVHHIERYTDNEELRTDVDNGITLCHWCHREVYGKEDDFKEYFKQLIEGDKND